MSMWVSILNQGSMKYELYSYIEHDNVIEQQMPAIHVQNQYGNGIEFTFFGIHYIFSVVCVALHYTSIWQNF